MKEFEKLGIDKNILKAIEELGFETPTEVQEKTIPAAIKGKDIIAGSATGSGKTLAFGASIIQKTEKNKGLQALILTPTRELANQIKKAMISFAKIRPVKIIEIYGGVQIEPQIRRLKTAEIVIGTPGRVLDHMRRRTIDLTKVKTLVLDEADRMLDMGFIDDVEKIIKSCPENRQTMLFSATISGLLGHVIKKHMKDPIKVSAEAMVDPKKLTQIYYDVPDGLKFSLLVHLLEREKSDLVMVFCNTQRNTDFIEKNLKLQGIQALALHGGYSQGKRNKTMEKFHAQNFHVLVCTDVAARGLDIPAVSHVYNYDISNDSKDYVHRIGRTARAGKSGIAVNILGSRDHDNFGRVLRDNDVIVPKEEAPFIKKIEVQREESQNRSHKSKFSKRPRKNYSRRR